VSLHERQQALRQEAQSIAGQIGTLDANHHFATKKLLARLEVIDAELGDINAKAAELAPEKLGEKIAALEKAARAEVELDGMRRGNERILEVLKEQGDRIAVLESKKGSGK